MNMEAPIQQQVPRPNYVPQLPGTGVTQMMMGMRPGMTPMINPFTILPDQQEKKRQFAKSVYVSGFEKTVTTAMLQKHFSQVKPVQGIKLPYSKFNENKGYAFVYYSSQDDATLSKKQLDRSAILQEKIRVTKTVVAQNLSKMIFKMKTLELNDEQIGNVEKTYFNDENLEKQVEKVIFPFFGKTVQVNKIIIPVKKFDQKPLTYARVFFYISNPKQAASIVRRAPDFTQPAAETKNQYEIVLGFIADLLNKEESFKKHASAQIYEYTKKNQSNVLHLKGISYKDGESMTALADQLKEFIQKQNMQWQIVNCFAAQVKGKGAWANITFATYDDTKKAYQHLKTLRPEFRQKSLYGSLRNVKDLRTVVFSVIRTDVEDKQVGRFLQNLANSSPIVPVQGDQTPIRKYQYFSYNVIEQKSFYMDNQGQTVGKTVEQNIPQSWRFNNTVPRRLVVHFFNDIDQVQMRNLLNDIKVNPQHSKIFMIDQKKNPLRANHQKGHIKNNSYVKHTQVNRQKKRRIQLNKDRPIRQPRPEYQNNQGQQRMPRQYNNNNQGQQGQHQPTMPKVDYNILTKPGIFGGMPKTTSNMGGYTHKPQYGQPPMGGKLPAMGGIVPPMGGMVPPMGGMGGMVPPMGGMSQPSMGGMTPTPMGGMKPMGMVPPMGGMPVQGGMVPPMMGMKPQGGMVPPMMGGMPQKPFIPGQQQQQPPKQQ